MRYKLSLLVCLLSVLLLMDSAPSADAQTLLYTLDTPNQRAEATFGYSMAMGDINGDGRDDIAVGAPYEQVGGNASQGRAYIFSGADGSLIFTLNTPNPQAGAFFGFSIAVRDTNGDGKGDIIVGAPLEDVGGNVDQGRVYVFSGVNASLLFTLDNQNPQMATKFGWSVAAGNVSGDGKGDIAVGAPGGNAGGPADQGRVFVFSGMGGSLLFTLGRPGTPGYARFGHSVAVGDVNDDGKGDIAVGAPWEEVGGNTWQGRAYVFSGIDGSPLFTLDTPAPREETQFGHSVAVGDVDGDGQGDIAIGTPTGEFGPGQAYVFSGADRSLLFNLGVPGSSVVVDDVNSDSKGDIVVGADGDGGQGRAYVYSGGDGSLLFPLNTANPQWRAQFGFSVAAGDVNGDGKGDMAVGAPYEDVGGRTNQGRVYVFLSSATGPAPTVTPTRTPITPTSTSTPCPTPTPPHQASVGGTVKLAPAAVAVEAGAHATGSRSTIGTYAALVAGGALLLTAGGWGVRRRKASTPRR